MSLRHIPLHTTSLQTSSPGVTTITLHINTHMHTQVLSDDDARANYNAQLEVALKDEEDDYTGALVGYGCVGCRCRCSGVERSAE